MKRPILVHRGLTILVVLSVTTLLDASAQAQKLLRWKFQPGQTFQLRVTQQMKMEYVVLDKPINTTADMAMDLKWSVEKIEPDGTASITQTFERMLVTMETPGVGTIKYDSASPDEPTGVAKALAASVKPLVGARFLQRMSSRGEVLEVKPSDEATRALSAVSGGARMGEAFSEEGINRLFRQSVAALPENPVRPGDHWASESVVDSPNGPLKTVLTYTYAGTASRNGQELDKITVQMQITFVEDDSPSGAKVAVKSQSGQGTMYFDSTAGRFVETDLNQVMTLATKLGQQEFQQRLDIATTMKVTDGRLR